MRSSVTSTSGTCSAPTSIRTWRFGPPPTWRRPVSLSLRLSLPAGAPRRAARLSLRLPAAERPSSERDVRPQTDHEFVLDLLRWIVRVGDSHGRIDEILHVRL